MSQAQPKLSMTAVAIYVVLMAERQSVDSKELAAILGIQKLPSDSLKQLKDAQLIDVGRAGRTNTYRLSDTGWARCLDIMGTPANARGSAPRALLALLQALHRGFRSHTEIAPKQFFMPSDEDDEQPTARVDVEALVRKAYAHLSRMPGDWVPLAKLRDHLAHLERRDVDSALESLALQPGVQLIPWDNRKALTDRDRAAALHLGGDDNHALRIEEI
jgi:hypothetical protein